jgi:hypothetical protein
VRVRILGSLGRLLVAAAAMLAVACASASANPLTTTITLTVQSSGDSAQAAAALSDTTGTPSGTVTYSLYRNGSCTSPAATSEVVTLGNDGSVPASSPTGPLAAGQYAFRAAYSGGGLANADATSDCQPFTVAVHPQPVTIAASATPPSADYGNTVILAVAVLPAGATGSVSFAAGGQTLCVAFVSSGGASCTTAVLPTGSYAVTATYGGDGADLPATAQTAFTITPNPAAPAPDPTPTPGTTTTTTTTPAFHFVAPPSIEIAQPVNAGRYTRREVVRASYSCSDGAGAPGLSSCQGSVTAGARIDTAKPGRHTFSVTSVSRSGESTVRTLHYMVYVPSNRIAVAQPDLKAGGGTVRITVPDAGRIAAVETGWPNDEREPPSAHQTVLATAAATVRNGNGSTVTLGLRPVAAGRSLLRDATLHWLRVRLVIAFAPTGGARRQLSRYGLLHIR